MVSASMAVWVREPEVPVKVMVGAAEAVVIGAVKVRLAEDCAGVSVSVDGFAVTPEGRPEIATEIVPLNELSAEAVMVTALLVVPAFTDKLAGEAVSEKSGVDLGVELPPQVVRKRYRVKTAETRRAFTKGRMGRPEAAVGMTIARLRQWVVFEIPSSLEKQAAWSTTGWRAQRWTCAMRFS